MLLRPKALLMLALGCLSCINIVPMPEYDASVLTMNGLFKSGKDRTGGLTIASLSDSNAEVDSCSQPNASFLGV